MPIHLGYSDAQKLSIIRDYVAANDIDHIVVISPPHAALHVDGADHITYADVIMYVTFYRLLQEIHHSSLVVINECLRTQNRYDLTYNCIRNYLNQTHHQLIFQHLPQINTREDFMVLFDFDTGSRWKRRGFDIDLILDNTQVCVQPVPLQFHRINVPTSSKTRDKYTREKERLFAGLGNRDPHTIPRNLYLIGGADKLAHAGNSQGTLFAPAPTHLVARNQRLKCDCLSTYDSATRENVPYAVLEIPHRFIDFSDFMFTTGQSAFAVLVADLKVDHWYFNRYSEWSERIHATYAGLQ